MRTALGVLLLAALAGSPPAEAVDLRDVLVDYTLTSWGEKDGLPSTTIRAIAQDADGYLWLGTEAGPVRFDGARFVRWMPPGSTALPERPVRAITVAGDG